MASNTSSQHTHQTRLLVPSHDLDFVTRRVLDRVNECDDIDVITAGPGEHTRGGIDAVPVRGKLNIKAIHCYRRIMRREEIDMTFSPSTSGLATMLSASVGLGVTNIGYRGTQARVRLSDPTNYLALLNPRVRHVVCETGDILESMGRLIGHDKVSGMPKPYELSWVDEAIANPQPLPDSVPAGSFKLIYIGMAKGRPHKGLHRLVESMSLTGDRNIHLIVIGSYDEESAAAAPRGRVTFCGPRPGAAACIPGCDLLVLPSLRDASPRVLREAQACGVPCVCTDIPGARDLIIPDVTGLLVQPDNARAIADAVNSLYDSPATLRRMAEACRPHIRDNYALAPYADYMINLIRSLRH